ncbi:MAG: beta-N-acetylhexosaminidase [Verrucomicrobia bacterium]|nr:beta-N-acetylhexosaminidase [Verrucomicrobiota bacterium]
MSASHSEVFAGRRLVVGIEGTAVTDETVAFLRSIRAGGVILFARNIESVEQTKRLIAGLRAALDWPLLVMIDHEGGLVVRFKRGVTMFPGNSALGAAAQPVDAEGVGRVMGEELKAIGFDVNLAPVLDVLTPAFNPGITIRSFGDDADRVAELGESMIRGMQAAGLAACAKHLPGKGAATVDAHYDLPVIELDHYTAAEHLAPFRRAAREGVACMMTTHVVSPAWERDETLPATFSRTIATELVRLDLHHDGVLISDDLDMGAIATHWPMEGSAVRAVEAGHDLLLVCHDRDRMLAAHRALVEAFEAGRFDARTMVESDARLDTLIAFCSQPIPPRVTDAKGARLLQYLLTKRALEVRSGGHGHVPIAPGTQVAVVYPMLDDVPGVLVEDEMLDPGKLIRAYFEPSEVRATLHPFRLEAGPEPARDLFHAAKGAELILLVCFHAMVYARERELLRAFERFDDRLIVLVTRNPLDADLIEGSPTVVIAHGFRTFQIGAAIETLCGRLD